MARYFLRVSSSFSIRSTASLRAFSSASRCFLSSSLLAASAIRCFSSAAFCSCVGRRDLILASHLQHNYRRITSLLKASWAAQVMGQHLIDEHITGSACTLARVNES